MFMQRGGYIVYFDVLLYNCYCLWISCVQGHDLWYVRDVQQGISRSDYGSLIELLRLFVAGDLCLGLGLGMQCN
jgi:hypothetical protein